MNKIALILLLGLNLAIAETIAQDEYDEVEVYEEESEAVAGGNEAVVYEGDSDEYDAEVALPDDDAFEANTAIRGGDSVDSTDITRWNYTEEEILRKEALAKKQAEHNEKYKKSIEDRRRSGLFFGLGIGYSGAGNFKDLFKLSTSGFGGGVFLGYQQAFNEYSGFRAYGEVDYNTLNGVVVGTFNNKIHKEHKLKALANIDFYFEGTMGNAIETLGGFIGVGGGWISKNLFSKSSDHALALALNFGIHSVISTHHRIEVFSRVTPWGTGENDINTDIWLRYSYMF